MKENYEQVPNILTGKDLDYLSDMFNWNYGAYKSAYNGANSVKDSELKSMLDKASNIFHGNMSSILKVLDNGGSDE